MTRKDALAELLAARRMLDVIDRLCARYDGALFRRRRKLALKRWVEALQQVRTLDLSERGTPPAASPL